MDVLLAKTPPKGGASQKRTPSTAMTLSGHLRQCLDVVDMLSECALGDMVAVCGFRGDSEVEWFRRALRWCAVLHDLGKATIKFQEYLRATDRRERPHYVRHEVVSYWISQHHPGLARAIQDSFAELDEWAVEHIPYVHAAVLGHHLKFPRQGDTTQYDESPMSVLWSSLTSGDVWNLLEEVAECHIAREPTGVPPIEGDADWLMEEVVEPYQRRLANVLKSPYSKLSSMLRGALIAVDILGSVNAKTKDQWHEWLERIRRAFSYEGVRSVLEQTMFKHLTTRSDPELDKFQHRAAALHADVLIVKAGCGSGKTVLALRRSQNAQVKGLVISAPTTAVASQTFVDYGTHMGQSAQLIHSRSVVDMELLESPEEDVNRGTASQQQVTDSYEALERLTSPVIFCTVDSVLGVLTNRRLSLALLPRIATSLLVFDEVHLYDAMLFGHLLRFLEEFDVPSVIMTASLPPSLESAITKACKKRRLEVMNGPAQRENMPRYNLRHIAHKNEAAIVSAIQSAVDAGQKVLMVVNRVSWAVEWYERLVAALGHVSRVAVLHSHFKYEDRIRIQDYVVSSFRHAQGGFCAVTTQICEVSFDVSADLLISHIAPFPAIIQRLGRLNRRAKEGDPCRDAWFMDPPDAIPYSAVELKEGKRLFQRLIDSKSSGVSQRELANVLTDAPINTSLPDPGDGMAWFDLSVARVGHPMRQASPTISVITYGDWQANETTAGRLRKTMTLSKPRNRPLPKRTWRFCYIVDDHEVLYSPVTGGRWRDASE
ncbi:MAG: CRISPR-associated helicase Cas3' [Alicyclobacillus sp.]|nr:CRISPR-associated helicase Cas3' [Alicyclobacillus sp.]